VNVKFNKLVCDTYNVNINIVYCSLNKACDRELLNVKRQYITRYKLQPRSHPHLRFMIHDYFLLLLLTSNHNPGDIPNSKSSNQFVLFFADFGRLIVEVDQNRFFHSVSAETEIVLTSWHRKRN